MVRVYFCQLGLAIATVRLEYLGLARLKKVPPSQGSEYVLWRLLIPISRIIRGFDGASDLLVDIFGECGKHARSAVGMVSLPFNIAVEIDMVIELR